MFGPITIPYEAVMLYNVCQLKEGVEWSDDLEFAIGEMCTCLLYTSQSPRDATLSRMPSSA